MLIELEAISGGGDIRFENGGNLVTPFALTRPTHLPLAKRNTFSPTLPPTPEFEFIPQRERSFCSLPDKAPSAVMNVDDFPIPASRRSSCIIISKRSNPHSVEEEDESACCWRIISRWQKMRKKSARRDVTVNCDVISRASRKSQSSVMRRSALASQQVSLFGKENKREWGEEHHNDVVYAVMLKRIRRSPSPANEVSHGLLWETQKVRYIKGATLQHLVGKLCQSFVDDWGERNFLTVFLATYRSFATPAEVLDLIINEAEKLKEESNEKRVSMMNSIIRVLKTWLDRHFDEDFYAPPHHPLLKRLQDLAEEYQDDENVTFQQTTPENDCDFATFVKSKLQTAEVKGSQEEACESLNSTSHFYDMLDETDDIRVEEESLNMDAAKTFLSLLTPQQIAEQLTVVDANLFLRVVPYHCLNAVRSSKDKPATVKATIDQFNKVVFCVLGTCLCPGLKTSQRAKIICKWIEVAQECRELKNFSSLRAVVSGLQTHAIHRLKRAWQHVPHANCSLLEELSQINMKVSIERVGTAKVNTEKSSISRVRKDASTRRQQAIHSGIMHGTVPYLGSFLTDLTYLDTAKPDFIEKGLINFDKRRKEFELLAQLQLWQASCRSYHLLDTDSRFSEWFNSVTLPTDEQAIQLSEEIEPPNAIPLSPVATPLIRATSEMFTSTNGGFSLSSGSRQSSFPGSHMRSPSNDDASKSDSESSAAKSNGSSNMEGCCDEGRTINVQVIKKANSEHEALEFKDSKEMKLCSNDRSPAFMKKAFCLFDLENEDLHNFKLLQILSDGKELLIPETGNVFYAMNSTTKEFKFVLVEEGAEFPREKRANRNQTLPRSNKQKRHPRKATASTSTPLSSSSPMKSLYRHLGMTSGFNTPTKEAQRQDDPSDDKSDTESLKSTPELKHRKKSTSDSLSTCTHSSEGSSDESDSSLRQKVWKKLSRVRGHRRNHSDTAGLGRVNFDRDSSTPHTRQLVAAITDSFIFPGSSQGDRPPSSGSSSNDFRWPSTSSDGDPDASSSSTWPRKHIATDSSEAKLHRQAVIKKHHTHPRDGSSPHMHSASSPIKLKSKAQSPSKILKKADSRSKFYVDISDDPAEMRYKRSAHNDVKQPIDEAESAERNQTPRKNSRSFARSASEPCILELGENEVFQESIVLPTITVQSPSPRKTTTSPFNGRPRIRMSSETRTTIL